MNSGDFAILFARLLLAPIYATAKEDGGGPEARTRHAS